MKNIICLGVLGLLFGTIVSGYLMGARLFTVESGSMEPSVLTGAMAITIPVSDVKINDIIAFTSPFDSKKTVLHRVRSIKEKGIFTTKGDNNKFPDNWDVKIEAIKGKMVIDISYIGYIVDMIKKPWGYIVLIVFPATVVVYFQILTIIKSIDDEINKRVKRKIVVGLFLLVTVLIPIKGVEATFSDQVTIRGISIGIQRYCQAHFEKKHKKIDIKCHKKDNKKYKWKYGGKHGYFDVYENIELEYDLDDKKIEIDDRFYEIEE